MSCQKDNTLVVASQDEDTKERKLENSLQKTQIIRMNDFSSQTCKKSVMYEKNGETGEKDNRPPAETRGDGVMRLQRNRSGDSDIQRV